MMCSWFWRKWQMQKQCLFNLNIIFQNARSQFLVFQIIITLVQLQVQMPMNINVYDNPGFFVCIGLLVYDTITRNEIEIGNYNFKFSHLSFIYFIKSTT